MSGNLELEKYLKETIFLNFDQIRNLKFDKKSLGQYIEKSHFFPIICNDPTYGDLYNYYGGKTANEELIDDEYPEFAITKNNMIVLPIESILFGVTSKTLFTVVVMGHAPEGYHFVLKTYADFLKNISSHPKFKSKRWLKKAREFALNLWYDDEMQAHVLHLNEAQLKNYLNNSL